MSELLNDIQLKNILETVSYKAKTLFQDKLDSVILFGSYARGNYDNESDIDIMILVNIDKPELPKYKESMNHLADELSLENNVTISVIIKEADIFYKYKNVVPFYANVLNEGVILNG